MAQWLRTLATLAEDWIQFPMPTWWLITVHNSGKKTFKEARVYYPFTHLHLSFGYISSVLSSFSITVLESQDKVYS